MSKLAFFFVQVAEPSKGFQAAVVCLPCDVKDHTVFLVIIITKCFRSLRVSVGDGNGIWPTEILHLQFLEVLLGIFAANAEW